MLLILTNLYIQTHLSPKLQAFLQGGNQKIFTLRGALDLKKLSIPFLHWNLDSQKIPYMFSILSHPDFQTGVSV